MMMVIVPEEPVIGGPVEVIDQTEI
jgi:hypothetical protein